MVKGVEHDVVNWLSVTGDIIAHKKAIEFIKLDLKNIEIRANYDEPTFL